jgi:hypothetical protein
MKSKAKVYVGMDVHKDTVMIAVLAEGAREPTLVKRLSHDPRRLRRLLNRLARHYEVRACYEASGAGYVLERLIRDWGHKCEIVAPSLIPRRVQVRMWTPPCRQAGFRTALVAVGQVLSYVRLWTPPITQAFL